jgi:hypothetical protein
MQKQRQWQKTNQKHLRNKQKTNKNINENKLYRWFRPPCPLEIKRQQNVDQTPPTPAFWLSYNLTLSEIDLLKNIVYYLPHEESKHKNIELSHDVRVTLSWNFSDIDIWKSPTAYIQNPAIQCAPNDATRITHAHSLSGSVRIIFVKSYNKFTFNLFPRIRLYVAMCEKLHAKPFFCSDEKNV